MKMDSKLPGAHMVRCLVSILIITFISGCSGFCNKGISQPDSKTGIANPASVNCINKGGILSIQTRADGGQYGICIFENNRQCEEWALFRGECPAGGMNVTGYINPAAQFCVTAGGLYKITDQSNPDKEQGTCTFNSGKSCDVWDFYSGRCSKDN
jgi:putative hemolysin